MAIKLGKRQVCIWPTIIALAATATPLSAHAATAIYSSEHGGFRAVSADQFAEMLRNKDFVLINVHVPYEGEISQTDLFIPFDQIALQLNQLPSDRTAKIVLYCRSGRMSEIAANALAALGYRNVSHLAGGMNDWLATGHDVLHRK